MKTVAGLKPRLHQDTCCPRQQVVTICINLLPSTCFLYRQQNFCQFVARLLLDTKDTSRCIRIQVARTGHMLPGNLLSWCKHDLRLWQVVRSLVLSSPLSSLPTSISLSNTTYSQLPFALPILPTHALAFSEFVMTDVILFHVQTLQNCWC